MRCSSPLPCSLSSGIILWLWTHPRRHLREARLDPRPSCRPSILDDSQTLASRPAQNSERAIHTQPKPSINHQHLQHLGWASGGRSSRLINIETPPPHGGQSLWNSDLSGQTQTSRVMMILPAVALVVVWRISSMNAFALAPD